MNKKIIIPIKSTIWSAAVAALLLSGCATSKRSQTVPSFDNETKQFIEIPEDQRPESSPELENINKEDLQGYAQQNGVIFAKTDFEGVLKTNYVRLMIVDQEHPERTYQLHIGEKAAAQKFPWDVKVVNPGYFYIELPAGAYQFTQVSIPVGSTMAVEDMTIGFEVIPNQVTYMGTLKMVGTKERIKLGGVPVIKPGFEYTIEIIDEQEEGMVSFKERFPEAPENVSTNLMKLISDI